MAPICFCLFVHRDSWCPACLPVVTSVHLCCRDLKKKKNAVFELADRSECALRFDLKIWLIWFDGEQIPRILKQRLDFHHACYSVPAGWDSSLPADRQESLLQSLPEAQVARENSRREDGWNGVGVCLLFNMSAHTHFSKHPEACVCAHMCCDGWFCCSEPLKAPRFPLGGFSCRRVVSGNDCSFTWRPNWNMMLLNCKEVLISCFCHICSALLMDVHIKHCQSF